MSLQEVLLMPEATQYLEPRDADVAVEICGATLTWETEDENGCGENYSLLSLATVT